MKIEITKADVWHFTKMFLCLLGGYIGLIVFDIGTGDQVIGDENHLVMWFGASITLTFFGYYGHLWGKGDEE